MNNQSTVQSRSGLADFYSRIYGLVGIGIAISAVVSYLMLTMFQSTMIDIMVNHRFLIIGFSIAELALVVFASSLSMKNSPMALPLFLTYSALNGFTLSFIVAQYAQTTVLQAFVTSAILFVVMSVIGRVTKKDLSGMGKALMAALIGIIIASVVNIFIGSSGLDFILSIVTVLVFAGLIAWDNQKIEHIYYSVNGQVNNGWAVSMALSLYLDFINVFISLLRIFGNRD